MNVIKCCCGNEKCTTTITVQSASYDALVIIEHRASESSNMLDISLDANAIVALIKQLKVALNDITNNA